MHDKKHLHLHSYLGNYTDSILNSRIVYILNIGISWRAIMFVMTYRPALRRFINLHQAHHGLQLRTVEGYYGLMICNLICWRLVIARKTITTVVLKADREHWSMCRGQCLGLSPTCRWNTGIGNRLKWWNLVWLGKPMFINIKISSNLILFIKRNETACYKIVCVVTKAPKDAREFYLNAGLM